VRFRVYSSDFDAPGYPDRSLLLAGKLRPQSAVNQTDGGSVAQQNAVLTYRQDDTEEPITATAYLLHNAFKRWATFNLVPQGEGAVVIRFGHPPGSTNLPTCRASSGWTLTPRVKRRPFRSSERNPSERG